MQKVFCFFLLCLLQLHVQGQLVPEADTVKKAVADTAAGAALADPVATPARANAAERLQVADTLTGRVLADSVTRAAATDQRSRRKPVVREDGAAVVLRDTILGGPDSLIAALPPLPAAVDTTDSLARPKKFQPLPKKAALYSGIFPGLGQAYNRQYWKLPIVYGGAAVAGYFINLNLQRYRSYRKAYIARLSHEPDEYPFLTDSDLQLTQETYKRRLDMAVLFSTLGYAAQIIDALAAAHLKNFDISDDIGMRVGPMATPGGIGFGLAVHFK
jgi:hypothetical protein